MNYLLSINDGLHRAMKDSDKVILIGEDLVDPYGGAFKVTKGISTAFPKRVYSTPISESAIIGVATGLAIRGFFPVAEIMFGDFLALCADQLLNSAAKFPLMYEGKVTVPIVVRTPMGGGRGYGPTHSQSIEKMFFGVPGLKVVAPSLFHDPSSLLYNHILFEKTPTLFVEFKQLYPEELITQQNKLRIQKVGNELCPVMVVDNFEEGKPDVIAWGYGSTSIHLKKIATQFVEEEIKIRLLIVSHINSFDHTAIEAYIKSCAKHIVVEEGTAGFNWGSELTSSLYENFFEFFDAPIKRIASANTIIPASKEGEVTALISQEQIEKAIIQLL